jgi:drug/metabolite transporter (DMT)-like permease
MTWLLDSLEYLSVAEAILLSFTCPILTAYASSVFLHAPFDKKQLVAGAISFLGVVLIAQPGPLAGLPGSHANTDMPEAVSATPAQRLTAVLLCLLGALGGTCAYTTIRVIGTRVHPLISVNYYAFIATCFSGFVLLLPIFPDVTFRLPHGLREWGLLIGLGISGFFLQFLMTSGLVKDKSSRATNMMYSSVVFGLGIDYAIWGAVPGWLSWVGGAIVTAATVWGSMQKGDAGVQKPEGTRDEEYAMVPGDDMLVSDDEDNEEDERNRRVIRTELQKDTI